MADFNIHEILLNSLNDDENHILNDIKSDIRTFCYNEKYRNSYIDTIYKEKKIKLFNTTSYNNNKQLGIQSKYFNIIVGLGDFSSLMIAFQSEFKIEQESFLLYFGPCGLNIDKLDSYKQLNGRVFIIDNKDPFHSQGNTYNSIFNLMFNNNYHKKELIEISPVLFDYDISKDNLLLIVLDKMFEIKNFIENKNKTLNQLKHRANIK